MREHDVVSGDGTRIRAWHTEHPGVPVLLCPGLGTSPDAWPLLVAPHAGVRVHSWYHRGTMGSARPADESRIGLADHLADALAVLDAAGLRRCVVLGWSVGVTVAVELALRHPERVSGLLLVAGAPGDPFEAMLAIPGLPPAVRRALTLTGTRLLRLAGPLVDGVLHHLPVTGLTTAAFRHSGLALPASEPAAMAALLRRFLQHDWRWYFTLALAMGDTARQDLTGITCPTTVLAGRYDLLASAATMARSLAPLPQNRLRMLPTTHFLPLEAPGVVTEELTLLLDRVAAVERALHDEDPPAPFTSSLTSGSREPA